MNPKDNSRFPTNRLVSIGVFSFFLFVISVAASPRLHAAPLESFLLFYSNNIQGETDACG